MRTYQCPSCQKDGISWFGRRYSVKPMPTQCRHCKRYFYPKRRADKYPRELIALEVLFWLGLLIGIYVKMIGFWSGLFLLIGYAWLSGAIAEKVTYLVPGDED